MSLKHSILGWLSWQPASGYDLKKAIAHSGFQPWTGNNNQIYTALLQLAKEGLVQSETHHREDGPTKKTYTITPAGLRELQGWALSDSELPEWRNAFLLQLAWSEVLSVGQLDQMIAKYEEQLRLALLMVDAANSGSTVTPSRSNRERFIWEMIADNRRMALETEKAWLSRLRNGLGVYQ